MTTPFAWLISLPLIASPLIYIFGHWRIKISHPHAARHISFAAFLLTWIPYVLAVYAFSTDGPTTLTYGAITLRMDGVSLLLAGLALGLGTVVSLYSHEYMAQDANQEKFYAMLVMMTGMMIGLGFAADLFNLWVWFEGMAISSYLLVAFYRQQPGSLEAGVKYLTQSAVGSVFVLLGIALVFAMTGTLDMAIISTTVQATMRIDAISTLYLAAGALFMLGFGIKVAMIPLHTWLPDAHSQAPSGISAMLSGVVIETGLIAMLRALAALSGMSIAWGVLLIAFGMANMLVGNLMALRQTQVKRMLAYSSLTHVGYMLIGFGVGLYAGDALGLEGGLFHMLTHGMMKGLAFLSAGALLWALHIAQEDHDPLTLHDLNGASRRYPVAAFGLALAVLALGGLPPLAGFMSKWQIFQAGMQTQNTMLLLVVTFAGLNSVLSLAYYAPVVNRLYRHKPSTIVKKAIGMPMTMRVSIAVLTIAVIAVGFWPGLLTWLTGPAGISLLNAFGG